MCDVGDVWSFARNCLVDLKCVGTTFRSWWSEKHEQTSERTLKDFFRLYLFWASLYLHYTYLSICRWSKEINCFSIQNRWKTSIIKYFLSMGFHRILYMEFFTFGLIWHIMQRHNHINWRSVKQLARLTVLSTSGVGELGQVSLSPESWSLCFGCGLRIMVINQQKWR